MTVFVHLYHKTNLYREAKAKSNDNYVSILSTNHSLNFSYPCLSVLINKALYSWLQLHILKLHVILYLRKEKKAKSLSRSWLFVTSWTVAYQAPQSMEFSRQEYWSGLPFPSPGDLTDPGIKPGSPTLQADALPSEPPEGSVKSTNFQ